jgi:hypothetical protein
MHYSRLLFFLSNLILVTDGTAAAQPVSATIDATRTGSPITKYPEKHNRIVKAMKQVDPSIKVIASGATPEEMSCTYIESRQLGRALSWVLQPHGREFAVSDTGQSHPAAFQHQLV